MAVLVGIRHLRAARMCGRAARPWFDRNGLSWNEFLTVGVSSDVLRATGDVLALKVVELAEAEAESGG